MFMARSDAEERTAGPVLTERGRTVWKLKLRVVDTRWRCELQFRVRRKTIAEYCKNGKKCVQNIRKLYSRPKNAEVY